MHDHPSPLRNAALPYALAAPPLGSQPSVNFTSSARYPDPAIEVLDPAFLPLRLFSSSVEQLATGMHWAEGPVWFGDGRYLLVSDIPNNRILRWDECSGAVSVFRQPSNNANGHTRDLQGRLVSCEHLTRRITRTEFDGSVTSAPATARCGSPTRRSASMASGKASRPNPNCPSRACSGWTPLPAVCRPY